MDVIRTKFATSASLMCTIFELCALGLYHYNASKLWSVHHRELSIKKVCAKVVLIAENSSTDVLAASLIFSGEAENSPVT